MHLCIAHHSLDYESVLRTQYTKLKPILVRRFCRQNRPSHPLESNFFFIIEICYFKRCHSYFQSLRATLTLSERHAVTVSKFRSKARYYLHANVQWLVYDDDTKYPLSPFVPVCYGQSTL